MGRFVGLRVGRWMIMTIGEVVVERVEMMKEGLLLPMSDLL